MISSTTQPNFPLQSPLESSSIFSQHNSQSGIVLGHDSNISPTPPPVPQRNSRVRSYSITRNDSTKKVDSLGAGPVNLRCLVPTVSTLSSNSDNSYGGTETPLTASESSSPFPS
ncbi:hypothetical protein BGZ76_001691 [Entomortierella beljakovae]|nr:hypothetical protein BGZ76_001691 [Entomortierella beljakovae]